MNPKMMLYIRLNDYASLIILFIVCSVEQFYLVVYFFSFLNLAYDSLFNCCSLFCMSECYGICPKLQ